VSRYPDWLTGRYFGGSFVADTPGNDESAGDWPDGRSAPAAQECCDYLLKICNSPSPASVPVFVFLVGGAGNGKSYLAKKITNQLKGNREDERGKFANRSYEYMLENGGTLHVVNDATIPPRGTSGRRDYLVNDIANALSKGSSMLACVNRGILVSEASTSVDGSEQPRSVAVTLVRWLLSGKLDEGSSADDAITLDVSGSPDKGRHYAFCSIKNSGEMIAEVHVAFMDQCSLFEPFPDSDIGDEYLPGPILVPQLPTLSPISSPSRAELELPGREALSGFYTRVASEISEIEAPGGEIDPVIANIDCLSDPQVLHGFCNILRAAEIITGNHFTYRDVWGLSVIALLGPVPAGDLAEYEQWVSDQSEGAEAPNVVDQLKAVTRLAMCRMHMTLFSAFGPAALLGDTEQPAYPTVQALECAALADPLICLSDEVIRTVKDKLTLLDDEKGPGKALSEENELFAKVWTPLDQKLEDTILKWLYATEEEPKFSERNEVLAWYGQYLARLLALVSGKPAYDNLVNKWQKIWGLAASGSLEANRELSDGLHRLLFTPFSDDRDESYLPLFSSRVTPVTPGDEVQRVTMKVSSREYHWEHQVHGRSILMILKKYKLGDSPISQFLLDFPMLRETDARSSGSGFTEASIDVEPRVERVRARILAAEVQHARKSGARPAVVFVDRAVPIT